MGKHWDPNEREKFQAFNKEVFEEIKARATALGYDADVHQRNAAIDVLKLCDMIDALLSQTKISGDNKPHKYGGILRDKKQDT